MTKMFNTIPIKTDSSLEPDEIRVMSGDRELGRIVNIGLSRSSRRTKKMTRYILNYGLTDLIFPALERVIIDHEPNEFLSREEGLEKLLTAQGAYISEMQEYIVSVKKARLKTKEKLQHLRPREKLPFRVWKDPSEERDKPLDFVKVLAEFLDTNRTLEEEKKAFKTMMRKMKEDLCDDISRERGKPTEKK